MDSAIWPYLITPPPPENISSGVWFGFFYHQCLPAGSLPGVDVRNMASDSRALAFFWFSLNSHGDLIQLGNGDINAFITVNRGEGEEGGGDPGENVC